MSLWLACADSFSKAQAIKETMAEPSHSLKVGYVMLGVAYMKRATNFYRDQLGLKEVHRTDDVTFFDAGTISIVVSTAVEKSPGSTEVVFSVGHVEKAYQALNRAGIKFEREPHQITDSSWAANFRDPDGHILSLYGPK